VNRELDRIIEKPDTSPSKSILGGSEPSQESSVFGAKLYGLDVIETLNVQDRADSRSFKLSHPTFVDIDLNGIR